MWSPFLYMLPISGVTGTGVAGRHATGADRSGEQRRGLEGAGEHLYFAAHDGRGVTANRTAPAASLAHVVRCEPPDLLLLASGDRLETRTEAITGAGLHFADHQVGSIGHH